MGSQVKMFDYFFGSDARSIPILKTLLSINNNTKVITTENNAIKRSTKIINPVLEFCLKNKINFEIFNHNKTYSDMQNALVCSFGVIFSEKFIKENNPLYNLHFSLLPDLPGPSPVEYSILNNYKVSGLTLFKIDKDIDTGEIYWQSNFTIEKNDYATDLYNKGNLIFDNNIQNITLDKIISSDIFITKNNKSKKISKNDLLINDLSTEKAKLSIRAFNYIGPARYSLDNEIYKIHSYTEEESDFKIELSDGILNINFITPPNRSKMNASDWLRGKK